LIGDHEMVPGHRTGNQACFFDSEPGEESWTIIGEAWRRSNKLSMWEQLGWTIEECLTGSKE
jgi:hypothetical protein